MTYNNNRQIDKEQFFTQEDTAQELSNWLKTQGWFSNITRIIEPSAGDGVWLNHLNITQAYDLQPQHPNITKANYLEKVIPYQKGTLLVGNPPFGRRGSLALQFINKGATEADYIAFILPASFGGKTSIINSIHPSLHLIYQREMFDEKFRYDNEDHPIRCVFQVWEKRCENREKIKPIKTIADFQFTTPQDADFAYVTHGYSHGKVIQTNFATRSPSTTKFIKVTDRTKIKEVRDRLSQIDYKAYSKFSTRQPCINPEEIIKAYQSKWGHNAAT